MGDISKWTRKRAVTAAAFDVLAAYGAGDYLIQCAGPHPLRVAEAAAAPADPEDGHPIPLLQTWSVTAAATPIWVWCPAGGTVAVISDA